MAKARVTDVVIAGGGIIGLSLGLELRRRGVSVAVIERGRAMREASWAAGGMLVGQDSENPPALRPLALYSLDTYSEFLERIAALSGDRVPFRTKRTLLKLANPHADEGFQFAHSHGDRGWVFEHIAFREVWKLIPGFLPANLADRFLWLEEDSIDPRDLCRALPLAFRAAGGTLLEDAAVVCVQRHGEAVQVSTEREEFHAANFVNCCGAWAGAPFLEAIEPGGLSVAPVKGQMVSVALPVERLRCVLRTPEFYAIPRGDGRVAIGATAEQAGFDKTVEPTSIRGLIDSASCLLPEIDHAPQLESWAGLRPGTPDGLPILGPAAAEHCWHATGHFRDGILLAPGTARLMAQLLTGEQPDVTLESFAASRFRAAASLDNAQTDDGAATKLAEVAATFIAPR